MKNKLLMLATLAIVFASIESWAATWGVKELHMAAEIATDYFKSKQGEAAYNAITGVNVELNSQKLAAKAKITYNNGTVQTASYLCHEHSGEIDCH